MCSILLDYRSDPGAYHRQDFAFEPGIRAHENGAPPRGVRQRKVLRREKLEAPDPLCQSEFARSRQIMRLSIGTHQQSEAIIGQCREQLAVPFGRTFGAGRKIAAGALAGVAETHRHQRDLRRIVEGVFAKSGPFPQPVSAWIVPRYAAGVDFRSGCLTDDEKPGSRGELDNRARPVGKMFCANRAGRDLPVQAHPSTSSASSSQRSSAASFSARAFSTPLEILANFCGSEV